MFHAEHNVNVTISSKLDTTNKLSSLEEFRHLYGKHNFPYIDMDNPLSYNHPLYTDTY